MKDKLIALKDHFNEHRFAYGVTVGATFGLYCLHRTAAIHNEFLKEHGLFDEFYSVVE